MEMGGKYFVYQQTHSKNTLKLNLGHLINFLENDNTDFAPELHAYVFFNARLSAKFSRMPAIKLRYRL